MEILYFTVTAVILYVVSDMLVNQIEKMRGERMKNRSLVFFAIIMILAVTSFNLIEHFIKKDAPDQSNSEPVISEQIRRD